MHTNACQNIDLRWNNISISLRENNLLKLCSAVSIASLIYLYACYTVVLSIWRSGTIVNAGRPKWNPTSMKIKLNTIDHVIDNFSTVHAISALNSSISAACRRDGVLDCPRPRWHLDDKFGGLGPGLELVWPWPWPWPRISMALASMQFCLG
jgi:hypothetical protein